MLVGQIQNNMTTIGLAVSSLLPDRDYLGRLIETPDHKEMKFLPPEQYKCVSESERSFRYLRYLVLISAVGFSAAQNGPSK